MRSGELSASARRLHPEGGSFRDPASRVFLADDGRVLRALSERGLEDWRALDASKLFERAVAAGTVLETELDESAAAPAPYVALLHQERVPFVSYPYEWTFAMLRDAALLQLDLLLEALDEGLVLKDATPYNVQFRGAGPVFMDVGSFERRRADEPWAGYRQFCMQTLYPLLVQAYRGVAFQPLLRGRLDGIAPAEAARLLGRRDRLRRGVVTHVSLHARLERRHAGAERDVEGELKTAGFHTELVAANARGLRKLVAGLSWRPPEPTTWQRYTEERSYAEDEAAAKRDFVSRAVRARRWPLVWDLGANDGTFSRIAAEHAGYVLAVDSDQATLDDLYAALGDEGSTTIQPLLLDLADPSPALGWRGAERKPLAERGAPDLVLCLALLHHLVLTHGVPLADAVDWLASLGSHAVVEFVAPEDPMAQRLIRAKRGIVHPGYERPAFERLLEARFDVLEREPLASGTRTLYFAAPRG